MNLARRLALVLVARSAVRPRHLAVTDTTSNCKNGPEFLRVRRKHAS
jgi:hypothetical protein